MTRDILFWDVDTQYDFMCSDGNLYVPGAEGIIDAVSRVRRLAMENGYSILGDMDWHHESDDEISHEPDFERTFPPHCMAGTPGAERVGYLGKIATDYVPIERVEPERLKQLVDKDQFHVIIRKATLDVFGNPNTDTIVDEIDFSRVIVFGVALDFCVQLVLKALARKRPNAAIYLLRDVTASINKDAEKSLLDELKDISIEVTDLSEARRMICGC